MVHSDDKLHRAIRAIQGGGVGVGGVGVWVGGRGILARHTHSLSPYWCGCGCYVW